MTTRIADRKKLLKRLKGFRALVGDGSATLDPALISRIDSTIAGLEGPVRITLAGPAGSNHYAIAALLAGTPLSVDGAPCPTLELRAGAKARTVTVIEGRERIFNGCVLDKLLPLGPSEPIRLYVPAFAMPHVELTVLPAYAGNDDRSRYLLDMIDDTDAVIWCSDAASRWSPNERRLWFTVPDDLKSRAMLVLTGAERLEDDADAREAHEEKLEFVAEDFAEVLPVLGTSQESAAALVEAICARTDGPVLKKARVLREEISTIPIGTDQVVPMPEPAPTRRKSTDPATEMRAAVAVAARDCAAAAEMDGEGYAPVFGAMAALLDALRTPLSDGLRLDRDHDALCVQLTEASDLVVLLGYEETPEAAQEAAALVRQIATDILDRLPDAGDAAAPSGTLREAS